MSIPVVSKRARRALKLLVTVRWLADRTWLEISAAERAIGLAVILEREG